MGGPLKFKFANHFIIYQKTPLRGLLGLAGYTQSSGTGELRYFRKNAPNFSKLITRYQTDVLTNKLGKFITVRSNDNRS